MIVGVVNEQLEATINLIVVGPDGRSREVIAVIDTGYNGSLTLPIEITSILSLPQGASREVTLGDASRRIFDYYNAEVVWESNTRRVRILCVEGDPLIGTQLLEGHKMDADFIRGGVVILMPIP